MNDFDVIPMLSVHPTKIHLFSKVQWNKHHTRRKNILNLKKTPNVTSGKVSVNARRKISNALEYLIFLARAKSLPNSYHGKDFNFKISFVTLTLSSSQIHTDNEIKSQLLNQFLIEARRKWHVKNYLWKSEKQANGNIHFHVLTDKFIPWSELRDVWNRIQNKLGYVDRYRDNIKLFFKDGFRSRDDLVKTWPIANQKKAYLANVKSDFHNPNSTDIHSIRRIGNIKSYIAKYMTKSGSCEDSKGRLWSCNYELSSLPGAQIIADQSIKDEIRRVASDKRCRVYQGEYFTVLYIDCHLLHKFQCTELWNLFSDYLIEKFDFHYQLYT